MRIAIFSDTFPPEVNGVANYVYLSAKALAEREHEVQVFTASRISQKKLNEKTDGKFKIFTVPSLRSPIYADTRIPFPSGITFSHILKFRPQVIHAHTPFTFGWGAVMGAKILKIPLIGTHHTFYDHFLKHAKIDFQVARRATWKYTISFYNFCDLVTAPSQSLAKEMKNHGLKKPIIVLPNFVNTDLFQPATKIKKNKLKKQFALRGQSIVYMGRLSYEKNIDQIVRAFKIAAKKRPDLKLMLIGDGPEKNNLKKLVRKMGLVKKIIFTGFLRGENLVRALQANDIFVTASQTETFCIAALEALAVGLPVVAAKEKGLQELIQDKKNGFLVNPNSPREIAQSILEIFSNKKILNSFSQAARLSAANHSREKEIENLENIYLKLAKVKK